MARGGTRIDCNGSDEVEAFMATLDHPHRPAIAARRQVVRSADPAIGEGIQWLAKDRACSAM
jgi:hypothetical protein